MVIFPQIVIHTPNSYDLPQPAQSVVSLVSIAIQAKVYERFSANVTLKQVFRIGKLQDQSAKMGYQFPKPESSAVTGYKAIINNDLIIEAVCMETEKAKRTFEEALKDPSNSASMMHGQADDIFEFVMGNIPSDSTLEICISYVVPLQYDTEYEASRFYIPLSIAPRYGSAPEPLANSNIDATFSQGLFISVDFPEKDAIDYVQCLSHESAKFNKTDNIYSKLSYGVESFTLSKDFVVVFKSSKESSAKVTHQYLGPLTSGDGESNILSGLNHCLAVSITPKIQLKPILKEIIFVLDRSGSMYENIETLKSALRLYLASFPIGAFLNFVSFGSHHELLWPKSKQMDEKTFDEVNKFVDTIEANMGGTEILSALKSSVKLRQIKYENLETEILLLTDGQVYEAQKVYDFVEQSVAKSQGKIRFFSLGIGDYVSHELIQKVASAGRGYCQNVLVGERMEKKVVRMLRASLAAHMVNIKVRWQKEFPDTDNILKEYEVINPKKKSVGLGLSETVSKILRGSISLDSKNLNLISHIQTPKEVPPLFNFVNSVAYIFFRDLEMLSDTVTITAESTDGQKYEISVPVSQCDPFTELDPGIGLLAAQNLLGELENDNIPEVSDSENVGKTVALNFKLLSKWTSFIATEKSVKDPLISIPRPVNNLSTGGFSDQVPLQGGSVFGGGGVVHAKLNTMAFGRSRATMSFALPASPAPMAAPMVCRSPIPPPPPQAAAAGASGKMLSFGSDSVKMKKSSAAVTPSPTAISAPGLVVGESEVDPAKSKTDDEYRNLSYIVKGQNFDGSWNFTPDILSLLSNNDVDSFIKFAESKSISKQAAETIAVWAYMETQLGQIKESWELMADKGLNFTKTHITDESTLQLLRGLALKHFDNENKVEVPDKKSWASPGSSDRNKEEIYQQVKELILRTSSKTVLEIGSGFGVHIKYFASELPHVQFTPSEAQSKCLEALEKTEGNNIGHPLVLNLLEKSISVTGSYDGVIAINVLNLVPLQATERLFELAKNVGSWVALYGAFKRNGQILSESDQKFDESLKERDNRWGLRDIEGELDPIAKKCGFHLDRITAMEKGNWFIVWLL